MNNIQIHTDAVEVYNDFYDFSTKEMKKALTQALRKAANILKTNTRKNFKAQFPTTQNPKYNDKLVDGIRSTKVKDEKGEIRCYVLITSTRKSGSGSFRLHILERGNFRTQPRMAYKHSTKHAPAARGNIQAAYFFDLAKTIFNSQYTNILNTEINKAITKINAKKR